MKVSFLVTFYNQQQYVSQAIDSILSLPKDFDWEVLIGDDGSSDNTLVEAKKYQELYPDRIRIFVMDRDKNKTYSSVLRASANRLNLLKNSTGDFFCILDGDDSYYTGNWINAAISILSQDDTVSIVAGKFQRIQSGNIISTTGLKAGKISTNMYLMSAYIPAGACVMRRFSNQEINRLEKIGFFDDNDIVIACLNNGKMVAIKETIYCYHMVENSTTHLTDRLEFCLINVQAYDAERLILNGHKWALESRYSYTILKLLLNKKQLTSFMDDLLILRYVKESQRFAHSIVYDALKKNETRIDLKRCMRLILLHPVELFLHFFRDILRQVF